MLLSKRGTRYGRMLKGRGEISTSCVYVNELLHDEWGDVVWTDIANK